MSSFSLSVLSYGNFSGSLRDGPYLNCLPPLLVLLHARAAASLFRHCDEAEKEAECSDAPEEPERRRQSSAIADKAEEEADCSFAPE